MRLGFVGIVALVAMAATTATAISPADKCQADKLKRAGKYNFCRLKAVAKAVKTNSIPDYERCEVTFTEKWASAETIGAGQCPTMGDYATMESLITEAVDEVKDCLEGACQPRCGDGVVNGAESCENVNLGGATCASLGYALGGTLACTPSCGYDVSGCQAQAAPATGQTTSYGFGTDGDVQAGAPLSYTDNGDGTISDNNTGLMWEKKSADGSIHDFANPYSWCSDVAPPDGTCDGAGEPMDGTILTTFLNTLNDISGGGANCFAGHCDWRIPNVRELHSIVNYGTSEPAVHPAFNTDCTLDCTVLTCSCIPTGVTWSSTTLAGAGNSNFAWSVFFDVGVGALSAKPGSITVRAVRGGL